jgi:uncharacterized protein
VTPTARHQEQGPAPLSVGQHVALLLGGDFSRGLDGFAEDVIWHVPGSGPFGGDHRGREAMLALIERLLAAGRGPAELSFRVLTDHHGYLVEWLELRPHDGGAAIACPLVSRAGAERIVEVWLCQSQVPQS